MNAIRTTFLGEYVSTGELAALDHLTEHESCKLAEAVLDDAGTAYVDDCGEIVAYALTEDACKRLARGREVDIPSLDYASDLAASALDDLDMERDPRRALELLREELREVAAELRSIAKGETS